MRSNKNENRHVRIDIDSRGNVALGHDHNERTSNRVPGVTGKASKYHIGASARNPSYFKTAFKSFADLFSKSTVEQVKSNYSEQDEMSSEQEQERKEKMLVEMDPGDPYASFRTSFDQEHSGNRSLDVDLTSVTLEMSKGDWLQGLLMKRLQATHQVIPGPYALYAGNAEGVVFKAHTPGYDVDDPREVASGSKWHTGITVMALVEEGKLDFNASISTYLDFWTKDSADPRSRVKVHHLLQFTSGFGSEIRRFWHTCIGEETSSYKACARKIYDTTYGRFKHGASVEPGQYFFYDHTHTEILAAIAEEVTGKPWMHIYNEKVAQKIGFKLASDGSNGWGYAHADISKELHISANDNAKFMTALFSTMLGKGPFLAKEATVRQFLSPGVTICRDEKGPAQTGHNCWGWLKDKMSYASTHFVGLDGAKNVYSASPGHWGFWPEMVLPYFQKTLPPQGGFWWQLAIQLPGGRTEFFNVQYYQVAEAVRKFMFDFMKAYKKEWGLVQAQLPQKDCSWPDLCDCKVSDTYPHHPAEKRRCAAGIKTSCTKSQLHDKVCKFAQGSSNLFSPGILNRKKFKRVMKESCSLKECLWGTNQMVAAGCPVYSGKVKEQCFKRSQKAGIRCCSNSGHVVSAKWGPWAYGCHSAETFVEATLKCASYGLRLCSKHELRKLCWKTGCNNLDASPVWVSETCPR